MSQTLSNQSNQFLKHTFAPLDDWLSDRPEISLEAKAIYSFLKKCGQKTGEVFPSRKRMAEWIHKSVRSVDRYIKELEGHNLVAVEHTGWNKPNRYTLLSHEWMRNGKTYKSVARQPCRLHVANRVDSMSPTVSTPYKDEEIRLKDKIRENPEEKILKEESTEAALSEEFEEVWHFYPRKDDRKKALEAYQEARKKASFDIILGGVKAYKSKCYEKNTPEAYIKLLCNWLRDEKWTDGVSNWDKAPAKADYSLKAHVNSVKPISWESSPSPLPLPSPISEFKQTPEERAKALDGFSEVKKDLYSGEGIKNPLQKDPDYRQYNLIGARNGKGFKSLGSNLGNLLS